MLRFTPYVDPFFQYDLRTVGAQEELIEVSNTANVSVYALDPSLIAQPARHRITDDVGPAQKLIAPNAVNPLSNEAGYDPLELSHVADEARRDVLVSTAGSTGGLAYSRSGAVVADVIREIEEDNTHYYLLTYATPEPLGDGRYHGIEVRVNRPGVRVRARSGYVDQPAEITESYAVASALTLPGTGSELPFDAQASRFLEPDGSWMLSLQMTVYEGPAAAESASGALPQEVTFHARAMQRGVIVDHLDRALVPRRDGTGPRVSAPMPFAVPWHLTPGRYELWLAFRQPATGRTGVNRLRVTVPEPCDRWCSSDVALMREGSAGADGPPAPLPAGIVPDGIDAFAYVQVYGGIEPVFGGEIVDAVREHTVARLPWVALDAAPRAADAEPAIGKAEPAGGGAAAGGGGLRDARIPIPGDLPDGRYVLVARLLDEPADVSQVTRVGFELLPGARVAELPTSAATLTPTGEPPPGRLGSPTRPEPRSRADRRARAGRQRRRR
jgi:hypothetical protein